MKQQRFWTNHEIARLRESYTTLSRDELLQAFAPRTRVSIYWMASRLKLRKRRDWKAIAEQHVPAFTLS